MFSFLKSVDVFQTPYQLSFDKRKNTRSRLGGLITLIMFIILTLAFVFFSLQLFARINPNLITKIRPSNRKNLTFGINTGFIIENQYNTLIPNAMDYLTIEPFYYEVKTLQNDDGLYIDNVKNTSLSYKTCDKSDFSVENSRSFEKNNLKYAICINDTLDIKGYFDKNTVRYLVTEINKCVNTTTRTCKKSPEEIDDFLASNSLQISLYYEELDFNPMNFSYPFTTYMTLDSYIINNDLCKIQNYFVEENTIMTDVGWVDNSYNNITMQEFEKVETRFYIKDNQDKCLVKTRMFVSEYVKYNNRIYMKAQDLLAQLGAIFSIISNFFGIFVNMIHSKKMDNVIMNKIFNLTNDDLDENHSTKITLTNDNKLTETDKPLNHNEIEVVNKSNNIVVDFNKSLYKKITLKEEKFNISIRELLCSSFCACLASERVKKKLNIFNEMTEYIIEYTDIVNYALLKYEFEKLLLVVFSESQLALFNLIGHPQNPERKSRLTNLTKTFRYSKSLAEQENVISNMKEMEGELEKRILFLLK